MDRLYKMLKIRAGSLWVCNYYILYFPIILLSYLLTCEAQIIRKSIELPVVDYLSGPKNERDHRHAKNYFYTLGEKIDAVRGFEVLSPHTPAAALIENKNDVQPSIPYSKAKGLLPSLKNRGNLDGNKVINLFSPIDSNESQERIDQGTRSSLPSTKQLEDEFNKIRQAYTFSYSTPPIHSDLSAGYDGQSYIPFYSTASSTLNNNYDPSIGYFNNFKTNLPISEVKYSSTSHDHLLDTFTTPSSLESNKKSGLGHEYYDTTIQGGPSPRHVSGEFLEHRESQDYYDGPEVRGSSENKYNEKQVETYPESEEKHTTISPSLDHTPHRNKEKKKINSKSKKSSDHDELYAGKVGKVPYQPFLISTELPQVPPTVGVIGWKSNSHLNTNWKPSKALMDMTDHHIKEDLNNDGYKVEHNKDTYTAENEKYKQENQEDEESSEENKSSVDENSEEEEDEEGEEEEEEEEGSKESEEQEEKDDDRKVIPLQYPPKYSDEEYKEQIQNEPHESDEYYNEETLPPGPPYYTSSFPQDERSKIGYLPPPNINYGNLPRESFYGDIQQTWTPIIPGTSTQKLVENDRAPGFRSENGQWQSNHTPNKGFGEDLSGKAWNVYEHSESPHQGNRNRYQQDYTKSDHVSGSNVDYGKPLIEGYHGSRKEESEEEPDDRINDHSYKKEELKSEELSNNQDKPTDYNVEPQPKVDPVEERERNRVSDHEFPRKVPTRLRYPGGGLWSKPAPGSGIELGFVPKKVYTQTRRFNTVKHLPREAALAQATTAEQIVNAPRLREVVSHKKIQEVYEEEGYEDSGYDHGGYKKHGENKEDTLRHDVGEQIIPENDEPPTEEEAFNEHVAHLEDIPENTENDPTGQSSANKQVVQGLKVSEYPKVKGSWKQQKVTTNERSMAFLDGEGKGGILTQRHKPTTEGVVGKYLDVNGETVPVLQKITNEPSNVFKGAISTNTFIPSLKLHSEVQVGPAHTGRPYSHVNAKDPNIFSTEHFGNSYDPNESLNSYHTLNPPNGDYNIESASYTEKNSRTSFSNDDSSVTTQSDRLRSKRMKRPQISQYVSRNNNSSFTSPILTDKSNFTNPEDGNFFSLTGNGQSHSHSHLKSNKSRLNFSSHPYSSAIHESFPASPENLDSVEYSMPSTPDQQSRSVLSSSGILLHNNPNPEIKDRKSRDLTAFGIDGNTEAISDEEFNHPTAAFRAIEDHMTSISSDSYNTPPRRRQVSPSTDSDKRYKEIVRNSSNQQTSTGNRRDKSLNVNLTPHDLNIRHPFLPRDGSDDVHIDYVQTRTRVQPKQQSRHSYNEDVELSSAVEELITTTTPPATSIRSKTTATEEYVAEDPIVASGRLKSNPFLSSIFPAQENQEDKIYDSSDSYSTTTPKITTYRSKLSSEETETKETPEERLLRLRTNPFLSSLLNSKSRKEEDGNIRERKQTPSKVSHRIKPIVVLPSQSDIEADTSVKHVEKLTLAQFSGPLENIYKQTPMSSQRKMNKLARQLNTDGVSGFHIVVRRSTASEPEQSDVINVAIGGTTTDIPVDEEKYPFYYSPESVTFTKNSPLRYATNPKDIPLKLGQGMEFYESRDKAVNCEEPSPPRNIVPKREKEGDWNNNPQPGKQRLGKLGDQIDCLKIKYFGEDPLDNPLFKEEEVDIPNHNTETPADSFGFNSDIVKNIKFVTTNNYKLINPANSSRKRQTSESLTNNNKENKNSSNVQSRHIYSSSYTRDRPIKLDESVEESKITSTIVPYTYEVKEIKNFVNDTVKLPPTKDSYTLSGKPSVQVPPLTEVQRGASGPVGLHPPKNVIISLRSKGTSNHPKIRLVKSTNSPYNANVNILPMGTVGYLKAHAPIHVHTRPAKLLVPVIEKPQNILEPVYLLDDLSNKASKIAKHKKFPTSVSYLTVDSNGKLIHQHIRTFVPIRTSLSNKEVTSKADYSPNNGTSTKWWALPQTDERRGEPKYRVKRSNENDKYINSKESMELKNFLLQKYREILAKEKEESQTQSIPKIETTSENYPKNFNPNKNVGEGHRPLYSSRYNAQDPMHGSSSTDVKIGEDRKETQTEPAYKRFPTRQPKVRFPKLHMTLRPGNDPNKPKLPETLSVKLITTTTTTTTEPPPSTTTRMYKPRVVYRKEFGKPLNRVGNMFAILKQRPTTTVESAKVHTTTENVAEAVPKAPSARRIQPKRLHQFEHRRVTKEEVIRETYRPDDELKERSDKVVVYDSPDKFDHPDLRGPVLRTSRGTPDDEYHEMLVYMVNPMTGLGEWKMMPVPVRAISRMDEEDYLAKSNVKRPRKRNRNGRQENVDINSSETTTEGDPTSKNDEDMVRYNMNEDIHPTSLAKKSRSKSRRKNSNRRLRNMKFLNSDEIRRPTPRMDDVTDSTVTTPEDITLVTTSSEDSTESTTSSVTPIVTSTVRHPKIIMEPHKRKYFYAKI